jgi:hypothetical protein
MYSAPESARLRAITASARKQSRKASTWSQSGHPVDDDTPVTFVADSGTLRVADVSDPAHPPEVGHDRWGSSASDVAGTGSYAFVGAVYPGGLRVMDVSNGTEDVLRFLGRKLHGDFQGEVKTNLKKRAEGYGVKHWMKRNSIKMYDKWSVLRVETTLNNPREFKVLKVVETPEGNQRRWQPTAKGVANFWRCSQVGTQANYRYLDALACAQPRGEALQALDHHYRLSDCPHCSRSASNE